MTELQKTLSIIVEKEVYAGLTTELLKLIIDDPEGRIDPIARNKVLEREGVRRISDIKVQTLDVIIDYVNLCLKDSALTEEEIKNTTLLKAYLGIKEGDFYKNGLQEIVKSIIFRQLDLVYADGKLTEEEAILQSETQGLFDLSYDQFGAIVKSYFHD